MLMVWSPPVHRALIDKSLIQFNEMFENIEEDRIRSHISSHNITTDSNIECKTILNDLLKAEYTKGHFMEGLRKSFCQ